MDTLRKQALECDFVRFTVADFHGISRGRYIPRSSVAQFLEEGVGVLCDRISLGPQGQVVRHDATRHGGNVILSPMPDTFHVLPWAGAGKSKVGEVLCETLWSPNNPQEACPRYVARKQMERLATLHGTTLHSGWEEEFYLLHQDTQEPVFKGHGALSNLVFAEHEEFYLNLQKMLEASGVEIEGMNSEYGSGQMEFVTKPVSGIRGVDAAFNFKEAVKEISAQKSFQALFMAKPYMESSGSGLHQNFSFKDKNGADVFYDSSSKDKLSEFAHFFIGGLIVHAKAIAALCCPTINCYRRMHITSVVPGKIVWGMDDRRAYLRVKFGSSGPYIENRLPSAAVNPYLVVAATIAAGLAGVAKKVKPPPAMDQSPNEFPHSLQEALQALEEDTVLTEALGPEFVDWFLVTKRATECEELKNSDMSKPTAEDLTKEHEMYAKFI